ncbi:hypothetical protein O181_052482 [Austropuccinia psidii MF-1]|uniref:Uncharacterized protein n=1 Tax=Austropuccinia psidii MF-1 TaxID=1389203 RepID=A0A9Q3E308_9BASI|nr:hypothetical protein [Austropuccinia psidii MF-1]
MAFLGHLGPLWLLQSVGQSGPFWPNPMRPEGAKGGSQVGPKPQLGPPEPLFVTNSLDPKLAKNPMDTILAINSIGPFYGHGPISQPWPLETTRSAQSAFPSTYGEFFPFLHTILT